MVRVQTAGILLHYITKCLHREGRYVYITLSNPCHDNRDSRSYYPSSWKRLRLYPLQEMQYKHRAFIYQLSWARRGNLIFVLVCSPVGSPSKFSAETTDP